MARSAVSIRIGSLASKIGWRDQVRTKGGAQNGEFALLAAVTFANYFDRPCLAADAGLQLWAGKKQEEKIGCIARSKICSREGEKGL